MERAAFVSAFTGTAVATRWNTTRRLSHQIATRRGLPSHHFRAFRLKAVSATQGPSSNGTGAPIKGKKTDEQSPYSATVNLPSTDFQQRANATKREPQLQQFWQKHRVYERLSRQNPGDAFVLHDGPPFANGPLHCGHALNKILKDFINKQQLMKGKKAVFVPGWDTHGLPIELKVLQSMKSKERRNLTPLDLRKKARRFANETVADHIEGMKRFGVWADWEQPYLTLQPQYEAAQIEVFGLMYEAGYVFRGKKPVHWSPSSRTALAEAELEYPEGHSSQSCYCAFPTTTVPDTAPDSVKSAAQSPGGVALSIWTTTPWTLPANRAVAVNAKLEYVLARGLHPKRPELVVVIAEGLVESTAEKLGTSGRVEIVGKVLGKELLGMQYQHPLESSRICRVVEGGDYITTDTGTGLVHTAPGHGQEDYQTGLREKLELSSPVDDAGKFTDEAGDGRFAGLPVLGEGNEEVLKVLDDGGVLLLKEEYAHKYPYDWRTKKPTIFRATEQWFISIDGFRDNVLNEIENVEWFPSTGIKRIRGMVEGRGDWCISRQRSWGVPIPVFYNEEGDPFMSPDIVRHIGSIFRERGSDAWWELEADELLPEAYKGRGLRKGRDTMDVWFDSGTSWNGVSRSRGELSYPADIYLEGSDQHRGWFQSSMLTSVAVRQQSPYKKVLTHGFVLDETGVKMSKSIGNVIDPLSVINGGNNKKKEPAYGADVLRLWVSSVDYAADIMIGPSILKQVADVYKKLRNTLRYMLGNLHDFDPDEHGVSYADLPSIDKYMLSRMTILLEEVDKSYDSFSFFRVYQALQRFAVVELSNFYLDIAKDRLYIPKPDSFRRRSCQTVLAILLENYAKALAPIVSHTAEDLWQNLPYKPQSVNSETVGGESIFQSGWFERRTEWANVEEGVVRNWEVVLDARDAVNKVLEAARVAKSLGASMEASVKIYAEDAADEGALRALGACTNDTDSLDRALIVSHVEVVSSAAEVTSCAHTNHEDGQDRPRFLVGMDRSTAPKCERCWHYDETVGSHGEHAGICSRCATALSGVTVGASSLEGVATGS